MKKCMVCDQETNTEIVIQNEAICYDCEQVIVTTDVDHPFYPLFVDRLKVIKIV